AAKLNVPRVLLPYNHGIPSNFTLKVLEEGCYKWTSSREEVKLLEIYSENDCSKEATVSAVTKSPTRLTAIIIAKDIGTGFSLRCDVIVDSIHRLEIVTTTRELYAEEAPEEFEVRAYDLYGNEFSTLEGQVFVWDLQTVTDHKAVVPAQTVLRFITFEASPYETPPSIALLESIGEQGNRVLIEGRQTGFARLSVQMGHPSYKVGDESVAYLEDDGISATGLAIGTTDVILRDQNVKASQTLKQPTATLNVVDPSYLTITIVPHNNPALIVDHPYVFLVNIYDKKNNKIFISDTIVVETEIPLDYISTQFVSRNGTYIEGTPYLIGSTKISAKLSAIEVNGAFMDISPPLKASLALDIYDSIRVLPSVILLPWDPITKPNYSFNLTVEGAHGSVLWSSADSNLVQVNTLGHCHTYGKGLTNVMASLAINPHNNDYAKVYIQEVLQLNILESAREVEVDKILTLYIKMGSVVEGVEKYFSQCHQLPLKLVTEEKDFFYDEFKVSRKNDSCVLAELGSSFAGFSKVSISYEMSKGILEDSVVVGVYKPLKPLTPEIGESVLALGTSRVILFEGGPLPWIKKPSSHFAKVDYEDSDILKAELVKPNSRVKSDMDIHAVLVECNNLGEATSSVKVICAVPDTINLRSTIGIKEGCPDTKGTNTVSIIKVSGHCYKPFPLEVTVKDSEGRTFENISSLAITWSVSDSSLANFPQDETQLDNFQVIHDFRIPLTDRQNLVPFGVPGEISVTASLTGYKYQSLKHLSLPALRDSLKVLLVKDAELTPHELVLFNHKENQGEVSISGGSGHFELGKPDESIAVYEYIPSANKIIVIPISDGNTTLVLKDLCLDAATTPSSTIRVSSLGSLDLFVRDRLELHISTTAEVVVQDTFGNHIPYHTLMSLVPHPYSNIISVSFERVNEKGNAVFRVYGKETGSTTLKMSLKKGASTLFSPSRPIQVFPALTIHPQNVTLLVGAVFQVETRGGPSPDSPVEFLMANETIASVSFSGVVTSHSLGLTKLTARAVGTHKDGEEFIIYSQDSVMIRVISLESIHIHSPLQFLETGSIMPLYAVGGDSSLNPMSYSTVIPPLLFAWSLNGKQMASFQTLYMENNVIESKENQGIIRIKALKPGRVSVALKVSVTVPHSGIDYQIKNNVELTDKIEIKIFESLKLKNPISEDGKILLSPNAETKIETNRDSEENVFYKVKCSNESESTSLVSVNSEGILKAGNRLGETSILISLTENFGIDQTISVLVEVRPISYFEIETTTFMKSAGKSVFMTVPLGVSHELKVRAHDSRGRVFTATSSLLGFRPSRFDLVNFHRGSTNDTLVVTLRNPGQTVLSIWDYENPHQIDYWKINSGPGIAPDSASVPYGSFICFSSNLLSSTGDVGIWKSDNIALEIDASSGVGIAHQVGKALVSYQVPGPIVITTELYIVPIKKIFVHSPTEILSNIKRENGTFIRVTFEGHLGISAKEVFQANAAYIPGEGFGCVLESSFDSDVSFATSEVKLRLGASVIKAGLQEDVETSLLEIPFIPSAVLEKNNIVVTDIDQVVAVTLYGNSELLSSFTFDYDDRLITVEIESIDSNKANFVIASKDAVWSSTGPFNPVYVSAVSSLTRQKLQIEVNFEKIGPDTCPDSSRKEGLLNFLTATIHSYQSLLFSIFCLAITVVCLIFVTNSVRTAATSTYSPAANTSPDNSRRFQYSNSPKGIPLWSVDEEPIYGDPVFRSSPRPAYDGSPTYSSRNLSASK
ncbi:Nuclear pore membrane glycoprotein, partial [Armadillidium vulgare]